MTSTPYSGHVAAPARKNCPHCTRPKIDIRKRTSFGIGHDGRLLCSRCWQKDITATHNTEGS